MNDGRINDLIRTVDPYRSPGQLPDARAEEDLSRILTSRAHRRRPYRRLALAAVATAAAATVAVVQPWAGHHEAAASPPPLSFHVVDNRPAKAQLLDLARKTRALRPERPGGSVVQVLTTDYGFTRNAAGELGGPTQSVIFRTKGTSYTRTDLGLVPTTEESTVWLDNLSTDPATLRQQMIGRRPGLTASVALWDSLDRIQRQTAPGPALRAAILTVLADLPGIRAEGSTVDRIGRPALGFSYGTDDRSIIVLIDPVQGSITAVEHVAWLSEGPKVIQYSVFTSLGFVDALPR
ncbi:hypothetical protein [Kribbella swartbergensis]